MIKKFSHLYFTLLLISFSCEDIVDVKIPKDGSGKLVVEAFLNSKPDVFNASRILLSRSTSFGEINSSPKVTATEVSLICENGDIINFEERGVGNYSITDTLTVGSKYKLKIVIDENLFESSWQKTPDPVVIDTVGFLKREDIRINSVIGSNALLNDGYYPTVSFKDPVGIDNHFAFNIIHPRLSSLNFIVNGVLLNDKDFISGSIIPLGAVWFNIPTESSESVIIELRNINKNTYEYYQQLQSIYSSQSPFSTPPFPTSQNIFNVNDPDEIVLGHFSITTTTRKRAKFIP